MMMPRRFPTLLFQQRRVATLLSTSRPLSSSGGDNIDQAAADAARRSAVAEARRSRAADLAKKRAELQRHLERHNNTADDTPAAKPDMKQVDTSSSASSERTALLDEAGAMTRALYRNCLRSVHVLRPGNDRDEADFKEREEAQLDMFSDDGDGKGGSMSAASAFAPPVDRENELESRAEYYAEWTRENFSQESDCLAPDPWREDDVERYLHFLRKGEERRRWVLKDYGFKDPFEDRYDPGRVDKFEVRAKDFLQDSYGSRGWLLQHELDEEKRGQDEEECIFDDDEDFLSDPPTDARSNKL